MGAMDKDKLIELLKDAWNDGNSMYHDCKYSHEYKKDLDNWLDANEDEINELCDGKNVDSGTDKALDIAGVNVMLPNAEHDIVHEALTSGLYATGRLLTHECDEIADGLMIYLKDYNILKGN